MSRLYGQTLPAFRRQIWLVTWLANQDLTEWREKLSSGVRNFWGRDSFAVATWAATRVSFRSRKINALPWRADFLPNLNWCHLVSLKA